MCVCVCVRQELKYGFKQHNHVHYDYFDPKVLQTQASSYVSTLMRQYKEKHAPTCFSSAASADIGLVSGLSLCGNPTTPTTTPFSPLPKMYPGDKRWASGHNRLATVFFYLSTVPEGGETVRALNTALLRL